MKLLIQNCNNIDSGNISIQEGVLNVKYAINGTGKTTIAKAIKNYGGDLSSLQQFKYAKCPEGHEPKIVIDNPPCDVKIFDEEYLEQYTFLENELLKGSFEVFVKTPQYIEQLKKIEDIVGKVSGIFKQDKALADLISVFQLFIAGFGKAKSGYSAAGSIAKGIGKGNKIENIPSDMGFYAPYLQSNNNLSWLDWCLKGKQFIDIVDNVCPCCATNNSPVKERISKLYDNYDAKTLKHFNEMRNVFLSLYDYFSPATNAKVKSILQNADALGEPEKNYLVEIKNQVQSLCDQLMQLQTLSFSSLKESVDIPGKIAQLRIDIDLYSHLNAPLTNEKVGALNSSIDVVLREAAQLKAEVGKQKSLVRNTVSKHKGEIDNFLSLAGYPYSVILEEVANGEFRLMLRHNDNKDMNVLSAKGHLSYGEKNALALALFMYSSLNENAKFIILDDPISSFDGNKKFALLDLLFLQKAEACFKGKTVLLLTHEFGTVIDIIHTMAAHFFPHPSANFMLCRKGVIEEVPIKKEDIKCCAEIYASHLSSVQSDLIKVIYYRRLLEVNGGIATLEYNLVSSLLHKRDVPTIKNDDSMSIMSDSDVRTASLIVAKHIPGFDYGEFLFKVQDQVAIRELYRQSTSSFEKLQLFRLLYENNETQLNGIVKKFVNEAYHIENEYLFGLDPTKFDIVPTFVIENLDSIINSDTVSDQK